MSLINEALKKAQRQRSLESAPLSAAPSGVAAAAVTTHVRAASHKRTHAALWFGVGLASLGAVTAVLVMRYGFASAPTPTAAVPVKPTSPAPTPAPSPAPLATIAPASPAVSDPAAAAPMVVLPAIPRPAPAEAALATPDPKSVASTAPEKTAAAITSPVVPPTANPLAPAVPTASSAREGLGSPAAPAPPVVPVVAVLTPAEREAKIYAFLSALRLTGVRGQDREARVLMNERVWRLNDLVSPELGLRLSAIRNNLLVFTDAQGKTYEKPY